MTAVADPCAAAELRRLRVAAGLTLRQLAARVCYSHTYLWELENGRKPLSAEVAARLDDALDTGGRLTELLATPDPVDPDALARVNHGAARPARVDRGTVSALGAILAQIRRLEDAAGTSAVAGSVYAHLDVIMSMVDEAAGPIRPLLVDQAAQWAQYAGWLHIDSRDADGVRRWHAQALEWATEAGNNDLCATVLSFRAWWAELVGQHGAAVGLTRAALAQPGAYIAEVAYDQLQLARALARTGDRDAAWSALEAGRDLAAQALAADPETAPPWHYYRSSAFYTLEEGTVYLALGEQDRRWAGRAVELLEGGLEQLGDRVEWAELYRQHLARARSLFAYR